LRGVSMIETVFGLAFFVACLIMVVAVIEIACAYEFNSRICRDAAKSAGKVTPSSTDKNGKLMGESQIYRAAQDVVGQYSGQGQAVPGDINLEDVSVSGLALNKDDSVAGPVGGFVTVTTAIRLRLPLSILSAKPYELCLSSKQTYPITAQTRL
jgi:hypothetical protein